MFISDYKHYSDIDYNKLYNEIKRCLYLKMQIKSEVSLVSLNIYMIHLNQNLGGK